MIKIAQIALGRFLVPPAHLAVRSSSHQPPATSSQQLKGHWWEKIDTLGHQGSTLEPGNACHWNGPSHGFRRFSSLKNQENFMLFRVYINLFYPIVSWILMCGLFCISPVLHPTYEHKKWTLLWQFSHSSAIDPEFVILLDDPDITSLVSIICLIHIFVNTLRKGTWKGFHDATQASEVCDEVATTSSQSSLHTLQTNDTLPKTNISAPKHAGVQ